jgi:4-oxalocrotonate tautomerase
MPTRNSVNPGGGDNIMPHVIVKMQPGRSEQQKTQLAEAITQQVMAIARVGTEAVSVAIEEVSASDWAEQVYRPDILDHPERLYKKPGYNPFG